MGDIHQPLHTETRCDEKYDKCDKGANAFPLPNHYEVDELHALWDKVLMTQKHNIGRPISESDFSDLQENTIDPYMATYKYNWGSKEIKYYNNAMDWAMESYAIATGADSGVSIYDGIKEN